MVTFKQKVGFQRQSNTGAPYVMWLFPQEIKWFLKFTIYITKTKQIFSRWGWQECGRGVLATLMLPLPRLYSQTVPPSARTLSRITGGCRFPLPLPLRHCFLSLSCIYFTSAPSPKKSGTAKQREKTTGRPKKSLTRVLFDLWQARISCDTQDEGSAIRTDIRYKLNVIYTVDRAVELQTNYTLACDIAYIW